MQPYFLPYLGYISLIKHTDKFILFDTVKYIKRGWIERNRILKPEEGWQYIKIPLVKFSRDTIIKDVNINNTEDWKSKILSQLVHYKKTARYYEKTISFLKEIFENDFNDMVSVNKFVLESVNRYLGFEKKIEIFSDMNLNIEEVNAPDEWALNICKALGNVAEYWNPPGGKSFFDRSKYDKENISLRFHSIEITEYEQKRHIFEPGLSVIDTMMFNSAEEINKMLDKYVLD